MYCEKDVLPSGCNRWIMREWFNFTMHTANIFSMKIFTSRIRLHDKIICWHKLHTHMRCCCIIIDHSEK
jgi:hypothetical protein